MSSLQIDWAPNEAPTLWSSTGCMAYTAIPVRQLQPGIYLALYGLCGAPLPSKVLLKIKRGQEMVTALEREVGFYENELKHLQGTVVPHCYGYFRGNVKGTEIGCMVMEYCQQMLVHDPFEVNRMRMSAICRLHQVGIQHNNLDEDGHHFIEMGNIVRIVDFSTATLHRCLNSYPILFEEQPGQISAGCTELFLLEKTFGIMSDGRGRVSLPVSDSVSRLTF